MSKKVKISIQGTEFLIPSENIQKCSYDNETYVYMRAKLCASIIKQYVKKNYPSLVVSATSDVYSGGSSVRVNVCNSDGSSISDYDVFEDIKQWEYILKAGSFNGMIDMYEDREDSPSTDNGTPMKYFPSYIFIENKPNWGTKHYWMNEWNEWCEKTLNPTDEEKEWIDKIVNNYGGWLGYNKQFMSKSVLKNIDSIMGCE